MGYDVLAFGEALLRLQPEGEGRLEDASRFVAHPGGAELNTCYALAGLGLRTAWFSVLPEGPLGRRVLRHLRGAGVDVSLVQTRPGRLGTYWVEYGREPRTTEVLYDRRDSTVCSVTAAEAPWEALAGTRAFYVSGITPALSPGTRELTLELAAAARRQGALVATDLNFRSRLWTAGEAAPVLEELARRSDVVILTSDDAAALFGLKGSEEEVSAAARQRFGCAHVVLTCGAQGAVWRDGDHFAHCPIYPTSRLDRVGAGDAFSAGFLYALLSGRRERALEYALALAALKHSLPGDTLLTTPEELERIAARDIGDIRR